MKNIKIPASKKVWFSSDFHLDHKNIIKYELRPFKTVTEMQEELIRRHNSLVAPDDIFLFLGDFSFSTSVEDINELLYKFNGKWYFLLGNHDNIINKKPHKFENRFEFLGDLIKLSIEDPDVGKQKWREIICSHWALRTWDKSHHGTWSLHGHSHGTLESADFLTMDVGCMLNNFYPFSYQDIKNRLKDKPFKPIDRHGKN